MPTFPRTILPIEVSELDLPGPLISKSQSGRVNIRTTQQVGRTWTERYLLKVSNIADRGFLALVRNWWRNGTTFDITPVDYAVPKGAIGGTPLINQPPQLVTDSENFGAWTVSGTLVRTAGQADPFGGTAAYLLDSNAGTADYIDEVVTFTGNANKATGIFVRAGTSTQSQFEFLDSTAVVSRFIVNINWSGGVPSLASGGGAGTTFAVYHHESWVAGWYLLGITSNSVVAGNVNHFRFFPDRSGGLGTVFAFGANAWNASTPAGYIGPSHPQASGPLLYIDGATASVANWLRAGDLIAVGGLMSSYEVTEDTASQSGGYVLLPINPPIFTGGAPADNAAVTVTGVLLRACIAEPPQWPDTSGRGADYGELLLSFSETL